MTTLVQTLVCYWFLVGAFTDLRAQYPDSAASTISSWQRVRIQRSGVSATAVSQWIQVNESFADNRHHWPTGQVGEFTYAITPGGYSMRRTGKRDRKSGRAFINLPDSLNLNHAGTFVIEVDMVVPKGIPLEAGVLLGVGGTSYTLFVLRGRTEFMAKRVTNDTEEPGGYRSVGNAITVDAERNTLRVEQHDGKLFFAINGQDVPGDAMPFRKFSGNGIGFISAADAVTFQNLRITIGR